MDSRNQPLSNKAIGSSIPRLVTASNSTSISSTLLSESDFRSSGFMTPLSSGQRRFQMTSITSTANRNDAKGIFNKQWQSNQLLRVCSFLETIPDDTEQLRQNLLQRQLTINSFIGITNILLIQTRICDNSSKLAPNNYVEKLPAILRKLNYRGQITRSLMSTVNTSHSLPHVVSMFAYLMDIFEMMGSKDFIDDLFNVEGVDPNENHERRIFMESSFKRVLQTSMMETEDDQEFQQKTYEQLLKRRGIHPNEICELEDQIKKMELELHDPEFEKKRKIYESQYARYKEIENDKLNLLDIIRKLNTELEDNQSQIEKYKIKSASQSKEIETLQEKLNEIDEILANQPHSKKDLSEVKAEKAELEGILIKKRQKRDHLHSISETDDLKIVRLRSNLQNKISDYNERLIEPCLSRPELKVLLLPESGLNYIELKQNIDRVKKTAEDLRNQVVQLEENKKRQLADEKENLVKIIDQKKSQMLNLRDKCEQFRERLDVQASDFKNCELKYNQELVKKKSEFVVNERHFDILKELDVFFTVQSSRSEYLLETLDLWKQQKDNFKSNSQQKLIKFITELKDQKVLTEAKLTEFLKKIKEKLNETDKENVMS